MMKHLSLLGTLLVAALLCLVSCAKEEPLPPAEVDPIVPETPVQPETPEPQKPTEPVEPQKPTEPADSTDSTDPAEPVLPNIPVADYAEEVEGQYFTMIAIEGGTFEMGATSEQVTDAFDDEFPVHSVTLTNYYLSQTEVTKAQYKAVMQGFPGNMIGGNFPATMVSHEEAQAFCKKLSQITGKNYVLPTEAQWEYAARGGKHHSPFKYSGDDDIDLVAWYGETEAETVQHPIALRKPNALGLFDLSGNVWEWCSDWYGPYQAKAQTNPMGPATAERKVLRGGSWGSMPRYVRVSNRNAAPATSRSQYYGFRIAMIPQ